MGKNTDDMMYKSLCKNKWKLDGKQGRERSFDCGVWWFRTTHTDRKTTQDDLLKICEKCEHREGNRWYT